LLLAGEERAAILRHLLQLRGGGFVERLEVLGRFDGPIQQIEKRRRNPSGDVRLRQREAQRERDVFRLTSAA
jgi:hypothetical protein